MLGNLWESFFPRDYREDFKMTRPAINEMTVCHVWWSKATSFDSYLTWRRTTRVQIDPVSKAFRGFYTPRKAFYLHLYMPRLPERLHQSAGV